MTNDNVLCRLGWSAVAALLMTVPLLASGDVLEGDPFRGRELLSDKLCTQCHAVWGHGGAVGPELSSAVAGKSWLDLVGDFWNHTPRMIDAMVEQGYPWPSLDQEEMADLLSYLYYLRIFDEPGDARRGEVAFSQLRCGTCHSLGGRGGSEGGPLDRFSAYPSPVVLGQAMWNAGSAMQPAQLRRWEALSIFVGREMADIQAFIRARGYRGDLRIELLPLPDPSRGKSVFLEKRCAACHGSAGRGEGPDLTESALNLTVSEISGKLWNHSYAMSDWMQARGIPFPRFEGTEMADLISYLYFLGFVGRGGEPMRGAAVFDEKGCAACHTGPDPRAMNLSASRMVDDPVALSAAMWNHAPEMHELMAEQAVAWPKFDAGDMEDLAAHLRRSTATEQAGGQ
jgi:cytochrome c2